MDLKKITAVFVFTALITGTTLIAFAAEEVKVSTEIPAAGSTEPEASAPAAQVPAQNENDTQWTWGEVVNLDSAGKTITLKYLDYETDQEKDIVLGFDEKTSFENIKSFDEIKIKDTLSIDYIVGPDGKNMAKNISLESQDSSAPAPVQAAGDAKQADTLDASKQPEAKPAVVETGAAASQAPETAIQK
ncbi:MAG: hypothetical protein PHC71_06295 [Candidatus Omnitrophica bacterium]|nr:hypothetical protein [Candidatus Omnitrophota bacterium]